MHVARQHHAIGGMLADQATDFVEGRLLVLRIDRNVEIGDAMPFHHAAQVVMVGDHAGNLAVQLAAVPAVQQVRQAMRLLAGHQHHALLHRRIGHPPLHGELLGNGCKGLAETVEIERQRVGTNFVTHEEPATLIIRVVTGFGNPAVIGGEKVTHLGDNTHTIRTGNHQTKSAHAQTPDSSARRPF